MKGFTREETRFSLCGLNCALCSMHLGGYCPGCGGGRRFPDAEKRIEATKAPGRKPGAFVGTTVWELPFCHSPRNSSFFLGAPQIFFILPAATVVRIGLMLRA